LRVLVTGADGFVARNLIVALLERGDDVLEFVRGDNAAILDELITLADGVVHLAGANRPLTPSGFADDNVTFTETLAKAVRTRTGAPIPLLFASSTQATCDNAYGRSKRAAEVVLESLADVADVMIYRLPNVFGKWARPHYNSAVATFCHCAARGIPLPINDPTASLDLVYIDDAISMFLNALDAPLPGLSWPSIHPLYQTTVGEVAMIIEGVAAGREKLEVVETGNGLRRAIYATYLSHLPNDRFSYPLTVRGDERGHFVEVLKTPACGQISYFTQVEGLKRGGHYHHSKSEKFVVVKGRACFRFRHLMTGERVDVEACGASPAVVDTIPGWAHDVVNMGDEELIVLVWANEVFDRERPDTFVAKIET
jgi:UDP-2-acetamido-2,6-beta-L-arabino-hexul-4-ose reductase